MEVFVSKKFIYEQEWLWPVSRPVIVVSYKKEYFAFWGETERDTLALGGRVKISQHFTSEWKTWQKYLAVIVNKELF